MTGEPHRQQSVLERSFQRHLVREVSRQRHVSQQLSQTKTPAYGSIARAHLGARIGGWAPSNKSLRG